MTVLKTGISWTNSTWNPWIGCKPVSAGCDHCYAAALVNGPRGAHFGGDFGTVKMHLNRLSQVRRFRPVDGSPHMVFVNSMSDFFFEQVPDEAIHQTLDVLEEHPQTIFQILSKRPIRARKIIAERFKGRGVPLHIWFGFTAEDNRVAKRVDILRDIKQRVGSMTAFLSVEPIVGPTDELRFDDMDWVITGGESGPRCRYLNRNWLLPAVVNAHQAGAALWHKQHGHLYGHPNIGEVPDRHRGTQREIMQWMTSTGLELLPDEKGGATIDRAIYRELPAAFHNLKASMAPQASLV